MRSLVGSLDRLHVEVTGQKSNSADEVIARLVDYGPLLLTVVFLAAFVAVAPYPGTVRWGFGVLVVLFVVSYQYLVSTDLRPTVRARGVSMRWFLTGIVTGVIGFYVPLSVVTSLGLKAGWGFGLLVWVPVQLGTGMMAYMAAEGIRQRHSLIVSAIGIVMTSTIVTLFHLAVVRGWMP